ncbi:hypothetical protein [Microcoleus sp. BROC3]|uniref:hypothetical protein n=1 Tax=Microcoleus sp. BROC3 TaxID=3055323 RepID=UPI002FD20A6E
MSQSQVVSFRAGGHFLNWIEAQRIEGESVSQTAQRLLKELSGVSTTVYTEVSTPSIASVASTELSTVIPESVDKLVTSHLDPIEERLAAIEERLGKLRA